MTESAVPRVLPAQAMRLRTSSEIFGSISRACRTRSAYSGGGRTRFEGEPVYAAIPSTVRCRTSVRLLACSNVIASTLPSASTGAAAPRQARCVDSLTRRNYAVPPAMEELAATTKQVNLARQAREIEPRVSEEIRSLMA